MGIRTRSILTTLGCAVLWTARASAEGNPCATAYEQAQELRTDGKLREARRQLEVCVASTCAEFIRSECSRWLQEVESSLPTIVLGATRNGREVDKVQVFCDDQPMVERLDGKAIAADPGPHTLRFVADGIEPVIEKVVLREGEKNRLVTVALPAKPPPGEPVKPAVPAPEARASSTNWTAYGLAGLGGLGIAGFAVLGLMGNSDLSDRERSCAPNCRDAEVAPIKTKYLLADVSLGIGVVSLGVAGYLLLTGSSEPSRQTGSAATTGLDVAVRQNGGFATWRARF